MAARELRCSWSADNDKASLAALQALLDANLEALKAVAGCRGVKRIVCGGCLDFKVVVTVDTGCFGAWEASSAQLRSSTLAN